MHFKILNLIAFKEKHLLFLYSSIYSSSPGRQADTQALCRTQENSAMRKGTSDCREVVAREERKEEEEWLNVALFATQSVENAGLSSDNHSNHIHKMKKKLQRVLAAYSRKDTTRRSNNKDNRLIYENKRKRALWNADTGLALWNNVSSFILHFERHLWVLVPLPPSVLQEDSVRFALMGQPSERAEDFPLLFNVNVAMACGTVQMLHTTLNKCLVLSLLLLLIPSDSFLWTQYLVCACGGGG